MASTLLASAVRTASGDSGALSLASFFKRYDRIHGAIILLTVSAAATAVGDTLDVYVQSSPDAGTTYDDFVHFTQVLGNGGVKKFLATWFQNITPETELHAPLDAALAAGVIQGPVSPTWRVKWVIAGTTQSFTFKVEAQFVL